MLLSLSTEIANGKYFTEIHLAGYQGQSCGLWFYRVRSKTAVSRDCVPQEVVGIDFLMVSRDAKVSE